MELDIRYAKTKMLANIATGETFLFDNRYFMVTDEKVAGNMKCVDLRHGVICSISEEVKVTPVKLKVVLSEEE